MIKREFKDSYTVKFIRDIQTGNILRETWLDSSGEPGTPDDRPSEILYCDKTWQPERLVWVKNNMLHRPNDKPAVVKICTVSGTQIELQYWQGNLKHRDKNKPSFIKRDSKGKLLEQHFYYRGNRHRTNGPAVELYNPKTGELLEAQYWVNGKELPNSTQNIKPITP